MIRQTPFMALNGLRKVAMHKVSKKMRTHGEALSALPSVGPTSAKLHAFAK